MRIQARDTVKLGKRTKQSDGSIKAPAVFSRTGNQSYTRRELGLDGNPNEVVVLNRPVSEVSAPESIASLDGKTMTLAHPPVDITPENWPQYSVGDAHGLAYVPASAVSGTVNGETHVRAAKALAALDAGNDELSVGYSFELDMTPGKDAETGEAYHGVQRNIRGNHHAIVDSGRCGGRCRVGDATTQTTDCTCNRKGNDMATMRNVSIGDSKLEIQDSKGRVVSFPTFAMDVDISTAEGRAVLDAADRFTRGMKDCMAAHDSVKAEIGIHKERADAAEKRLAQIDAMPDDDDEDDGDAGDRDEDGEPGVAKAGDKKLGDKAIRYVRRLLAKGKDAKKAIADEKAKQLTDAQVEERVIERSTVVIGAKKLIGDEFKDAGKTVPQIRAEAVAHVIAKDEALKPLAEAGLSGVALDKATTAQIAPLFATLVAAKGTRATDAGNAAVLRVLAHDDGNGNGTVRVGDESQMSPHQIMKFRDSHGGLSPKEFASRGRA